MSNQLNLRIAANYPNPPFFYTEGQRIVNGIDYHLIVTISRHLNLSYEFEHSNWEWGREVNGSWTGMIGKIVNNTANMALGVLTANPKRLEVVDFTIPYIYSAITFVMRMNKKSSLTARSLLIEPLASEVWVTLLSSMIFCILITKILKQKFEKSLQIVIRSLLSQGMPFIPRSLRWYSGLWLLCGLVLSHTYVSFLFLFMSELIPRPDISSIEELAVAVKDGHYIPSTSPDGTIFKFIKELQSPAFSSIGKALIPINKTILALELMLTTMSRLVFICPRPLLQGRVASLGSQNFFIPPEGEESNFLTEQLVIAIPKNFVLKDRINNLIRRLESSAHFSQWERVSMLENNKFYNNSNQTIVGSDLPFKGLALNTVKYILLLWTLCSLISLFVFGCEMKFKAILDSLLITNIRKQFETNHKCSLPKIEFNLIRRISHVVFSDIHLPHLPHFGSNGH